jgi:hypothetical protein
MNICVECLNRYNPKDMYLILFNSRNLETDILCKKCLFKLILELNNIFEMHPLLDGSNDDVKRLRAKIEIPPSVLVYIHKKEKIKAIKELRTLHTIEIDLSNPDTYGTNYNGQVFPRSKLGLKEAKDQVDRWWEIIHEDASEYKRTIY